MLVPPAPVASHACAEDAFSHAPVSLQPITMMRNALGRKEGGSGVSLDREKYEAATAYWESHAAIQ